MTWLASRNVSEADVPASRHAIWEVVSSPPGLARLTPLVRDIDGDRWRWRMTPIRALGVGIEPVFTHRGPDTERPGAEGTYVLSDGPGGTTHLAVDITFSINLPLPKLSRGPVENVTASMMARTGARFADNLCRELGVAA